MISSTTRGASPQVGSSSMRSLGRDMSARAMPSICCSPPESVPESSVVVLPAPLGPRTPTISPTPTSSDTPLTAATLPYRASSPSTLSTRALPAEVGLDHARVGLDLGGRSLGDLLAEVQHGDPVGDAHHEIHRVLDEEDGLAQLAQAPDVLVEALELELAHARRRLVEEE